MSFEAADDGLVVGVTGARPAVHDDIHCRELVLMMPERFADQAFDLVAPYGITDDARRYGEAETGRSSRIRSHKDGKHRIGRATCILIDAVEV